MSVRITVSSALENEENKENSRISPKSSKKKAFDDENNVSSMISPKLSKNGIFFKDETSASSNISRKISILRQGGLKMPTERRNSSIRKNSILKRAQVKAVAINMFESATKNSTENTATTTDASNTTASETNKMPTSNAQVDNARRRKFWGCMICYNRHNPIKSKYCLTCQQTRQSDRFVLHDKPSGSLYLAIADTASVLANVLLYCINSECQDDFGVTFRTILPRCSNVLSECVNEAFKTFISNKNEPEENSIDDVISVKSSEHSIISTLQRKDGSSHSPSKDWVKNPKKTLFEQVISNAQSIAYDSHIGRYIDSDIAVKSPQKLHDNLSYISLMKRASTELNKQVIETIKRRDYHDSLIYHYVPTKDEVRQRCNLCEFDFPLSQLVGKITFKTIANWKSEHDVPVPKNDMRLNLTNMHNPTAICLFCTQLFDAEFCDVIDTVAVQEAIGLDRRSSICKQMNFTNKAFKRIQQLFLEKSSLLEERPSSRMHTNLAVQNLKMRSEASNSSLRYQYNTQANTNNMIDQNKGGKYLREKYKDIGILMTEQKKQRKLDIEASERLMRLRNASIIAKSNGTTINDALKSLNKSAGSIGNDRTSSAPAELVADGYIGRKESVGNNSVISNISNTSSNGKRSISSKKSRSASTSRLTKGATPKAYKRSLSSKPKLGGAPIKKKCINSTLNSTGSIKSSSMVSSIASNSSRSRQLRHKRYNKNSSHDNIKALPRIKEKQRTVPYGAKNTLNRKGSSRIVVSTKLAFVASNEIKNEQNPKLVRKPLVLLVKNKNVNNTEETAEFTRIELPIRNDNLKINKKSVIPPISTEIVNNDGANNIGVSEMSLDQYFDEYIPVQEGIVPSLFKVDNEFDEAYNDDFESDALENNESSLLLWGDEGINITNESLDLFDGAGDTIDSYAWATSDVISAQNIQKECFSPDLNRPLSRLYLLSRGGSRVSTSNSNRKLRNANVEDNKMVMLSSPESFKNSKSKKKSKKHIIVNHIKYSK